MEIIENSSFKTDLQPYRSLDPRTKLLILVLINIIIFFHTGFYTETACVILICAVMLYHKRYLSCVKIITLYAALWSLIMVSIRFQNIMVAMLSIIFILVRKIFPVMIFGTLLISSTRVGEMISALQQIRIPKNIIIPLTVTIRFFPTIREEFSCILDAMKIRKIRVSFKNIVFHPLLLMEHILVPMMLRLSSVAEELSAAVATRGIDSSKPRTSYYQLEFGTADVVFILLFFTLMLLTLKGGVEVLL